VLHRFAGADELAGGVARHYGDRRRLLFRGCAHVVRERLVEGDADDLRPRMAEAAGDPHRRALHEGDVAIVVDFRLRKTAGRGSAWG
jgi:hypothetical protein